MRWAIMAVVLLGVMPSAAWGQGQMSDRVFGQVVVISISGVADEIQGDAICRRLPELMNLITDGEFITRYGSVSGGVLTARVAPVPEVKAFAKKIDFGEVTAIRERTIYVRATPIPGAGTEAATPLNRALAGLKSSSEDVRHSALEQLIAMKPNRSRAQVVTALERPLGGSDNRAKALAVKALARWNGRASIPKLLKVVDTGDYRDSSPRAAAIEILSEFKEPAAIEPIARRLSDVSNRWAAARALPEFGPAAEKATLKALSSKDADTRIGAYEVLEKIGGKASVAPLQSATKDSNKRVSSAATKALKAVKKRVK